MHSTTDLQESLSWCFHPDDSFFAAESSHLPPSRAHTRAQAQQHARDPFLVLTSGGRLTKQAARGNRHLGLVVARPAFSAGVCACVFACLHVGLFVWVGRIDLSAATRVERSERATPSLRHDISMGQCAFAGCVTSFQSDAASEKKKSASFLLANISPMIVVVKRFLDCLFNESPSAKCLCEASKVQ